MIARSPQFLGIQAGGGAPFHLNDLFSPRAEAILAFLFGFLAFMPYPALRVGANSGLQAGNIVSFILIIPCLARPWKDQSFYLTPLLLVPTGLSLLKVAVTDGGQLGLCFKSLLPSALSFMALIATQYAGPRHGLRLLSGIAAATILHVVLGIWQAHAMEHGSFPLLGLYINPSFQSVELNAPIIVKYIRRPFGLFPEPSAMSSSLAPFAIFWLGEACGLVRLRVPPSRPLRALFVVAAVGAIFLIVMSRSGHAMITLAAVGVLAAVFFLRGGATLRNYLALVLFCGVLAPLCISLATTALASRVGGGARLGDESWQERADSLWIGCKLWVGDGVLSWLFGQGPGLTTPLMWRQARVVAVWSVLLPYVYQTGIFGLGTIFISAYLLARNWLQTKRNATYAMMLAVWVIGITITTSYPELLPIWVAMGWLTVWPSVCLPAEAPASAARTPRRRWKAADIHQAVSRSMASRERRLASSLAPARAAVASNGRKAGYGSGGNGQ